MACAAAIVKTMSVSFDISFIRRDQKKHRNDETSVAGKEKHKLVSFHIKLSGETRNSIGMARLAEH